MGIRQQRRPYLCIVLCWVVSLSTTTTLAAGAFATRARVPTSTAGGRRVAPTTTTTTTTTTTSQRRIQQQQPSSSSSSLRAAAGLFSLRGGQQQQQDTSSAANSSTTTTTTTTTTSTKKMEASSETTSTRARGGVSAGAPSTSNNMAALVGSSTTFVTSFGKYYASSLSSRPILTKSATACGIFALSDYLAQTFEASSSSSSSQKKKNWTRTLSAALVGFCYFGPAAHYWYEAIFRLLPGTTLVSILQKAVLGQALFGPAFTCIFFASSLLQAGQFSVGNWMQKIRRDLPGAWLAGAGFWPLVDLVSYSLVPKDWIPLFVNMCSLVWTIYLSVIANRGSSESSSRTD